MESALFVGGVGDVLLAMFEQDGYTHLDGLTSRSTEIVTVEVNPHVGELFVHHPKRDFFKLTRMGLDDFPLDEAWRVRKGIAPFRRGKPRSSDVVLHPSPVDLRVLASLPAKYACIALSAGHPERSVSSAAAQRIAVACKAMKITPVYIGRHYRITSGLCIDTHEEALRPPGGVDLVDQLSLAGSLRCVEQAQAVFTAFTSAMLMAQFRKKPVLTIYPDKLHEAFFASSDNGRFSRMCGQNGAIELRESQATREAIDQFLRGATT